MDISLIVVVIIGILIISVVGSIIFTKKEQAAAKRRQQVASYRYRADEAQDLYDGLQVAGLEKVTYQFLLERIIVNLQEAFNIDPRAPGIKIRLGSAKRTLADIDNIKFYIQMPSAMAELQGLIARLNKLVKYLVILFQKRAIAENQYQAIMPAVQRTLLKFDAEGHIKMGHQAANDGSPGTAKSCYVHAKETLQSYGAEDSYVSSQLEKVEELIIALSDENGLNEVQPNQPTASGTLEPASAHKSEDEQNAASSQAELNRQSDQTDEFSAKKKW